MRCLLILPFQKEHCVYKVVEIVFTWNFRIFIQFSNYLLIIFFFRSVLCSSKPHRSLKRVRAHGIQILTWPLTNSLKRFNSVYDGHGLKDAHKMYDNIMESASVANRLKIQDVQRRVRLSQVTPCVWQPQVPPQCVQQSNYVVNKHNKSNYVFNGIMLKKIWSMAIFVKLVMLKMMIFF